MKLCPACRTQYSDDTLKFCLQDGTPLAGGFGTDTPTVVLGEVETVTSQGGQENVPHSEWQHSQVTHVSKLKPGRRGSNTAVAVAATAVGMLLLFGAVGIGAWLFLTTGQPEIAKNTANNSNASNQNLGANSFPPLNTQGSPSVTKSTSTPVPASTVDTSTKPVDDSQIRSEVSQKIYNWKSLTESKEMNSLRALYADRLDYYYTRRNVSSGTVIADKQRAFRNYNSLRINVEILSVTPDVSGDSATALYNKDWSFSGRKPFCGNIRSQMQLRKINGVWLITGEKDIPGTFRRTC